VTPANLAYERRLSPERQNATFTLAYTAAFDEGLNICSNDGFPRTSWPAVACQGLFGLTISRGAIANVLACVGEAITAPAERIAAEVGASQVITRRA